MLKSSILAALFFAVSAQAQRYPKFDFYTQGGCKDLWKNPQEDFMKDRTPGSIRFHTTNEEAKGLVMVARYADCDTRDVKTNVDILPNFWCWSPQVGSNCRFLEVLVEKDGKRIEGAPYAL